MLKFYFLDLLFLLFWVYCLLLLEFVNCCLIILVRLCGLFNLSDKIDLPFLCVFFFPPLLCSGFVCYLFTLFTFSGFCRAQIDFWVPSLGGVCGARIEVHINLRSCFFFFLLLRQAHILSLLSNVSTETESWFFQWWQITSETRYIDSYSV